MSSTESLDLRLEPSKGWTNLYTSVISAWGIFISSSVDEFKLSVMASWFSADVLCLRTGSRGGSLASST